MSIRQQLTSGGLHPTGITQGAIVEVPNAQTRLDLDLARGREPADKRRLVVVAQGDTYCRDTGALTVSVVPITSRLDVKHRTSMPLPASTSGLQIDSLALVHLVQPIPRSVCTAENVVGYLAQDQIAELSARLGRFFGDL